MQLTELSDELTADRYEIHMQRQNIRFGTKYANSEVTIKGAWNAEHPLIRSRVEQYQIAYKKWLANKTEENQRALADAFFKFRALLPQLEFENLATDDQLAQLELDFKAEDEAIEAAEVARQAEIAQRDQSEIDEKARRAEQMTQPSMLYTMMQERKMPLAQQGAVAVLIHFSQQDLPIERLVQAMANYGHSLPSAIQDLAALFPESVAYNGLAFRFDIGDMDLQIDLQLRGAQL